jgi:hypothetical protein
VPPEYFTVPTPEAAAPPVPPPELVAAAPPFASTPSDVDDGAELDVLLNHASKPAVPDVEFRFAEKYTVPPGVSEMLSMRE